MIAAILLGLLYQFYYGGGDTFNFHTRGSVHLADAIRDNQLRGLELWFNGDFVSGTYDYASSIRFLGDTSSFMVVRIAALMDLITFNTYSSTALFFALFSFSGLWCLFNVFSAYYPESRGKLAIATLFVPSVLFWGSGILKDTLVIAAIGWFVWAFYMIFVKRELSVLHVLLALLSFYLIFKIKIYILLCLLPAILIYLFVHYNSRIKSRILKLFLAPVMFAAGAVLAVIVTINVTKNDPRYSLENLARTAKITAYDIGFYSGKGAGSTYSLGELDGTVEGMLKLIPNAINVALFRPYPWEIRNALMAISSFESTIIFFLTVYILLMVFRRGFLAVFKEPLVIFCLMFALAFSYGVGLSTFNFGTLSRYRIPLLPFYLSALVFIYDSLRASKIKSDSVN